MTKLSSYINEVRLRDSAPPEEAAAPTVYRGVNGELVPVLLLRADGPGRVRVLVLRDVGGYRQGEEMSVAYFRLEKNR